MKKFSSILVALVMLFALCIPAFAGANVNALEDGSLAKEVATLVIAAKETEKLDPAAAPEAFGSYVAANVANIDAYADAAVRDAAVNDAFAALRADQYNRTWQLGTNPWKNLQTAIKTALQEAVERPTLPTQPDQPTTPDDQPGNTDPDLGISTFDPSGALDNIVDGISDNDLSGLFGTLRNTITDLSGRLSGVFSGLGGGNSGNDSETGNGSASGDDTFGGSEPTGDTAIYAVAGVAVVAAAALVFTKKKSESK